MPFPLQVVELGDRMCFCVYSESHPQRGGYRVDLLAHDGRGECACKWWRTHCWPLIRDGAGIDNPDTRCKHVGAARLHFLNDLLTRMALMETTDLTLSHA